MATSLQTKFSVVYLWKEVFEFESNFIGKCVY